MKTIGIIILLVILAVVLYELLIILVVRKFRRNIMYCMALKRAHKTGKRLLVIGDPNNDNKTIDGKADYGCGDICLDKETGCPNCPNGIKDDLEKILPIFCDNSYVIFVSCTLEYVDNFEFVKKELQRVSGGDLFIVHLEPNTIKTNFFPDLGYKFKRKRIIHSAPPYSKEIIHTEIN